MISCSGYHANGEMLQAGKDVNLLTKVLRW